MGGQDLQDAAATQALSETVLEPDLELNPEEEAFLLAVTGLTNVQELKTHILQVQADAKELYPYPCIRRFDFIRLKISSLPCYNRLLSLVKQHKDALFLDVGCCFGTDIRKAIVDGFPSQNIIGFDLRSGFWDIGHKLFKSDPSTFPVTFIEGDILDASFMGYGPATTRSPKGATPASELNGVVSVAPLKGRLSAIHASNFFHLFSEMNQLEIARRLGALLAPVPGSIIFGRHVSRPEKGFRVEGLPPAPGYLGTRMFCHSAESWQEMWDGVVCPTGSVKVEAEVLLQPGYLEPGIKFHQLIWCVTRL